MSWKKRTPDVFDLLLQVMGEGRLTDALGRTVDFKNTLILMTSNIGTREASGAAGFQRATENRAGVFLQAVERYFRPEFVNRLDRVVPFAELSRDDVLRIARATLRNIATREGFQRRRCVVSVSDEALDGVVRDGFNPRWGARGVRRALERILVRPAARLFAATDATTPAIISFGVRDGRVQTGLCPLHEADTVKNCIASWEPRQLPEALQALRGTLARLAAGLEHFRPQGEITAGNITPQQSRYLSITEFLKDLRNTCVELEDVYADDIETRLGLDDGRAISGTLTTQPPSFSRFVYAKHNWTQRGHRVILSEISSAQDIHEYFNDLFERGRIAIGFDRQRGLCCVYSLWPPPPKRSRRMTNTGTNRRCC